MRGFCQGVALLLVLIFIFLDSSAYAESVEVAWDQAAAYIRTKQYDLAIEKCAQAVTEHPQSPRALHLLGVAHGLRFAAERDDAAVYKQIAALEKAIELDSRYWISLVPLGEAYFYLGEYAKAKNALASALNIYPIHPAAPKIQDLIRQSDEELIKSTPGREMADNPASELAEEIVTE